MGLKVWLIPARLTFTAQTPSELQSVGKPKPQSAEPQRHGGRLPWQPLASQPNPLSAGSVLLADSQGLLTQLPAFPDWPCCPSTPRAPPSPSSDPRFSWQSLSEEALSTPWLLPPHHTGGPHIYCSHCSGSAGSSLTGCARPHPEVRPRGRGLPAEGQLQAQAPGWACKILWGQNSFSPNKLPETVQRAWHSLSHPWAQTGVKTPITILKWTRVLAFTGVSCLPACTQMSLAPFPMFTAPIVFAIISPGA